MSAPALPALDALLAAYKKQIDADIARYAAHVHTATRKQYGQAAGQVTDVFLDMLQRGGKRLRGALVMIGYELCGGRDQAMIVRAATALEMIQAYILIIDDIQDRAHLRRGKPTAHEMLAAAYAAQGPETAKHVGMSLALNAAYSGGHAAQMLLAGLQADAGRRNKVLGIVNQALVVTAHGQTNDALNALRDDVTEADVARVMEWKTSYYTFLNPLCVGMVLAGADCADTDAIRPYALAAGQAFQLTDDILGAFGRDAATGKEAMGDIREGKRTVLTAYALAHLRGPDRAVLAAALGNERLGATEFAQARQLIERSGALAHAQQLAAAAAQEAVGALKVHNRSWNVPAVQRLRDLARAIHGRIR